MEERLENNKATGMNLEGRANTAVVINSSSRRFVQYGIVAAVCLLLIVVGGYQLLVKPVSSLYIAISPQVSLDLNRMGSVTGVMAHNTEGITLLEGCSHKGKSPIAVTNELIDHANTLGFLKADGQLFIAIESTSPATAEKYQVEFANQVDGGWAAGAGVQVSVKKILSMSEVKVLVAEHFGLTAVDSWVIELDEEARRLQYELDFYTATHKYYCTVDAQTGEVVEYEV